MRTLWTVIVVAGVFGMLVVTARPVSADHAVFRVNSTGDDGDANPGDGTCAVLVPEPSLAPGETPLQVTGPCTLRAAIQESNAHQTEASDSIVFDIPPGDPGCSNGVCTIRLTSELPPIEQPLVIDGYSQDGAAPNSGGQEIGVDTRLAIEIDGTDTDNADGLEAEGVPVTILGLVINNFDLSAIRLEGVPSSTISGNFLGTDASGTVAEGNGYGVSLVDASSVTIGGNPGADYEPGARNLISGNAFDGVSIQGGSGNTVEGNIIGVDSTGLSALGNGNHGVNLLGSDRNVIRSNTISANGQSGVIIDAVDETSASTENVIAYNFIGGWDRTYGNPEPQSAAEHSGNGGHGVALVGHARETLIGAAPSAGGANIIDANVGDGVAVEGSTSFDNTISSNLILRNGGLGINLGGDDVTPNDELDADAGANNLQNFPLLTSVSYTGSGTIVTGTIDTTPNTNVRIEMFAANECDASGHGEGWGYMDRPVDVVTDPAGHAPFTWTMNGFSGSAFFTATATAGGNTSELSPCIAVPPPPGGTGGATAGPGTGQPPTGTAGPGASQPPSATPQPSPTPNTAVTGPGAEPTPAPDGTDTVSGEVPPGGTLSTDAGGDGATPDDPVETSVTSPNGGTVTIEETSAISEPAPAGYAFLGQQVNITAPPATPENPLILVFRLDASLLVGYDPADITVFREGVPLGNCTGATGTASPDPCVSNRQVLADGDLELTALTSAASAWNFGVRVDAGAASVAPSATDADGDGVPDTRLAPAAWNLTIPAALLILGSGGMFVLTRRSARARR